MQVIDVTKKMSSGDLLLALMWSCLIAITPLEHVPALRLFLLGCLSLILCVRDYEGMRDAYANAWPLVLWFFFCVISWFWSIRPQSTAYNLRYDLFPGLLSFGVFYCMQKRQCARMAFRSGMMFCAILNAFSGFFGFFLGWQRVVYYYSGVGFSSTVAIIGAAYSVSILSVNQRSWYGVMLLLFSLFAGLISANRMFFVSFFLVVCLCFFFSAKRRSPAFNYDWKGGFFLSLVIAVVAFIFLLSGGVDKFHRLFFLGDSRPEIWAAWLGFAKKYPILGIGYGRNVGQYTFGAEYRDLLIGIDPLAVMHSHNIFINSFLETGLVGFVLFVFFWLFFARRFLKEWRCWNFSGLAGIVVIFGFLVKNQTDIFFVKSTMMMVMGVLGYFFASNNPKDVNHNFLVSDDC